ncbi:DUF4097 family beta strand repeat-containing protein [Amycolatopsis cihanbeyliensis]|uniref:DUF4097 and DUF4098 domain-containing protein YvlB n=1 Tax=Amycolatopsis cihanbeyliensis TaxID=1128664 RepID=A0A542CT68_AMYCI|nr:DUF4097 family beta strand repeat-containing protein [Amycolatopsis cihanbeyliensis]TQI94026.1 DUF4097 and DUF4098 domain-containing protein YvlB [Amycolatopsis cihanbeyliensis]
MTEQRNGTESEELVRNHTFDAEGPLELDVSLTVGRVDIRLGEQDERTGPTESRPALVEVRHDPGAQAPWLSGVSSLLAWVGEQFGQQLGTDLGGSPADAVQQTRVEKVGNRLVVRGPKPLPLRNIPLAVTVHAPAGSALQVRSGAAAVDVTGAAGRVDVSSGSGEVSVERSDGAAIVRSGTGAIRLGPIPSGLHLRTGSGDVEVASLGGTATLATGTGTVWVGTSAGEVQVRSGGGGLSVADASSGSLELVTGSGDIRIGIRPGVLAEVKLSSGSGTVSSELDVTEQPTDRLETLNVRARTGSGNAVLTRATG